MESWSSATKPCFRGASSAEGEAGRGRWGRRGKGGGRRGVPGSRLRCLWPRCLHRRSQPSHGDLGDRSKKVKTFFCTQESPPIVAGSARYQLALARTFRPQTNAMSPSARSRRRRAPGPANGIFRAPRFKGTIRESWPLLESLPGGEGLNGFPLWPGDSTTNCEEPEFLIRPHAGGDGDPGGGGSRGGRGKNQA